LKITFQADADIDPDIERGLRRREPAIDFRGAAGVIPDGTPGPTVLQVTMQVHLDNFVLHGDSPGVLLIPSSRSIGAAIEGLLIVWLTWTPEDLRNQVRWLP
jgi:hypothetical protein